MTRFQKILIAGTVLAVVAGGGFAAFADNPARHDHFGPLGRICEAKDPLSPRMIERLQKVIKPTDAQKTEFEALKAALTSAEATMKASCPSEQDMADHSPTAMLAHTEQHLTAMLSAIKTVRPAFDALYAKLDDNQRDALRWSAPFVMNHHHDMMHGEHPMDRMPKAQ